MLSKLREDLSIIRGNLLVLIISWVILHFAFSMIFPYESPYIEALGASPFIIGALGSLGNIILTIVRIPGSYIADHYGRRQIIVTMTFGIAIAQLIYALAPDWTFIILAVLLSNLCLIYQPALEAITADSIPPEKRGLGFAMVRTIPDILTIFSPLIAGYIVENMGLVPGMRIIYTLTFIFALMAAIIRLFFLKETLDKSRRIKFSEIKRIYRESIPSIVSTWREIPSTLKILTLISIISAFEDPIYMRFSSLYALHVVRISKFEWGLVGTILTALSFILGIPLGKVVDIIGRKKTLAVAYITFIVGGLIFIFSKNVYHVILSFSLFAVGGSLFMPSYDAMVTDLTEKEKRGRVMGVMGTLNILAAAPASIIGGALYQLEPQLPFILTIITGLFSLTIILVMVKETKPKNNLRISMG